MTETKKNQTKKNPVKQKKLSKAEKHVDKFLNIELPELSKSAELLDYSLKEVRISSIRANKQVRTNFNEEDINELAQSIETEGLINPIELRRVGEDLVIISGERRFRAIKKLGWIKAPAIIRSKVKEDEIVYRQLIENLQRVDLSPIEESIALNEIKEQFKLSHSDIAKRIGKSKTRVTRTLNYINLFTGGANSHRFDNVPPGVLDELLVINDEPFYEEVLLRIDSGDITTTNIREEISKTKFKYLKASEKKEKVKKDINNILNKVEEVFYKQIDKNLLKLRIDFRQELSDEMIEEINTRVKKLEDELRNFSNFLKKEHLGVVAATVRLSDQNSAKKKDASTSTSLESIGFSKIDSKLASNKNNVIKFILEKIDIERKVLEATPVDVLVDHWNALPFYPKKIDKVQNWFFKSITKPFTLPVGFIRSKEINVNSEVTPEPYSVEKEIKELKESIKSKESWFDNYKGKKFEDLDLPTQQRYTGMKRDLKLLKDDLKELEKEA